MARQYRLFNFLKYVVNFIEKVLHFERFFQSVSYFLEVFLIILTYLGLKIDRKGTHLGPFMW